MGNSLSTYLLHSSFPKFVRLTRDIPTMKLYIGAYLSDRNVHSFVQTNPPPPETLFLAIFTVKIFITGTRVSCHVRRSWLKHETGISQSGEEKESIWGLELTCFSVRSERTNLVPSHFCPDSDTPTAKAPTAKAATDE